jgi:outer membrane protein assembly factor BamB
MFIRFGNRGHRWRRATWLVIVLAILGVPIHVTLLTGQDRLPRRVEPILIDDTQPKPAPVPAPAQRAAPRIVPLNRIMLPAQNLMQVLGANGSQTAAALFPIDRQAEKRLRQAKELIDDKKFEEAIPLLQGILDGSSRGTTATAEDYFFHPDPKDRSRVRSLKAEVRRMIGAFPEEGRKAYEFQYGAVARQHLADAVKSGDQAQLVAVSNRFFHTEAGAEATFRLGNRLLDQGRLLAAALCLERLRADRLGLRWEPVLSLKTALGWGRGGDRERAERVLAQLADGSRTGRPINPAAVTLAELSAELTAWLAEFDASPEAALRSDEGWRVVRGDADRVPAVRGGGPYLRPRWSAPTIQHYSGDPDANARNAERIKEWLASFPISKADRGWPDVPAAQPIVVGEFVIVRTFGTLQAYDLRTGRLAWETADKDASFVELAGLTADAARAVGATSRGVVMNSSSVTPLSLLLNQRAWRDQTYGSLSSDGQSVFSVEDLGFIGPWNYYGSQHRWTLRDTNRLVAYEARTGRALWEIGGERSDNRNPMGGTFFLGPPLPFDDRLYTLAEVDGEIRLLVLNPRMLEQQQPRREWSQLLVAPEIKLPMDLNRRQSGISPSYADGILVCPTEAGAVVAVDLTTQSLLWSYVYGAPSSPDDLNRRRMLQLRGYSNNGQVDPPGNDIGRWLDGVPLIAGGRVIVTPRDSTEIHCLNLADGEPLWKLARGEGMFVGGVADGVVLIVERSRVAGVRLSDGLPAWPQAVPIPMPSGRGLLSDGMFFLPLSTAELLSVDATDGRVVARSRSPTGQCIGNLVGTGNGSATAGAGGFIISQSVEQIESLPQNETMQAEVAKALEQNAEDAWAFGLRGELALQRGDELAAYRDLKLALSLKPDPRTRELLRSSLMEGLRVDFANFRSSRSEIESLLDTPEQRSRYFQLLGRGLEQAGDWQAAFSAYLKLVNPTMRPEGLEQVEASRSVRRDRLVQSRTGDIYARADGAERTEMDREVRQFWEAARSSDKPEDLRAFLNSFGRHPLASEARRELIQRADRIAARDRLDLEMWLAHAARSPDPAVAAPATARWIALLLAAGRPADALPLLELLRTRWPDVPCHDGQTARQFVEKSFADEGVRAARAASVVWPVGRVEVDRQEVATVTNTMLAYQIPIVGSRGHFLNGHSLEVTIQGHELTLRDDLLRPVWKVPLGPAMSNVNSQLNYAVVRDHLLIVVIGPNVIAVHLVGDSFDRDKLGPPRLLWQQSLIESAGVGQSVTFVVQQVVVNGVVQKMPTDSQGQPLGSLGPVTRDAVILQRGRKLVALEPLTGSIVWLRDDLPPGMRLFGDDEFAIAVPRGGTDARVFRITDGADAGTRELPKQDEWLGTFGRQLLLWQKVDPKMPLKLDRVTPDGLRYQVAQPGKPSMSLALLDAATGQDLWRHYFSDDSRQTVVAHEEVAILDPTGRLTLVELASGRKRFETQLDADLQLDRVLVVRGPERYVVIANRSPTVTVQQQVHPIKYGFENPPVISGTVYGLDRATGKKQWGGVPVDRFTLDLSEPFALPLLMFACRRFEFVPGANGNDNYYAYLALDQRTGRVIDQGRARPDAMFTGIPDVDWSQKQLTYRVGRTILRLKFTDQPEDK